MSKIRIRIILSWLLGLTACGVLFLSNNVWLDAIAWCLVVATSFLAPNKLKTTQAPDWIKVLFVLGLIMVLVLLLIHSFHPLPSSVVTIGKLAGVPLLCLMFFYVVYLDWRTFKNH